MPTWMILVIAAVVLVTGVAAAAYLSIRTNQSQRVGRAAGALRSRVESLQYRLDAAPLEVDTAEAQRLLDAAEAALSTARDRRSARAVAEGESMLDEAAAELDRVDPR